MLSWKLPCSYDNCFLVSFFFFALLHHLPKIVCRLLSDIVIETVESISYHTKCIPNVMNMIIVISSWGFYEESVVKNCCRGVSSNRPDHPQLSLSLSKHWDVTKVQPGFLLSFAGSNAEKHQTVLHNQILWTVLHNQILWTVLHNQILCETRSAWDTLVMLKACMYWSQGIFWHQEPAIIKPAVDQD